MKFTLYQIDAFTDVLFKGNPAAVIPLTEWIDVSLMQQLAMENNLSETVFFVPTAGDTSESHFDIRWFTPAKEINLCGHATLASAYTLFHLLNYSKQDITFHSQSGPLLVTREGNNIIMDFPSWKPERLEVYPSTLQSALGIKEIVGVYKNRDILVELPSESDVQNAEPDFTAIKALGLKVIITAPGKDVDFVSRFFAPTFGVDEDPVTGSAHAQLIPFWAEKLGKKNMTAKQLSHRGGYLVVEQLESRVKMGGTCVFFMKGEINL